MNLKVTVLVVAAVVFTSFAPKLAKASAEESRVGEFQYEDTVHALESFGDHAKWYLTHRETHEGKQIRSDKAAFCYRVAARLTNNLAAANLAIVNLLGGRPELGLMPELKSEAKFNKTTRAMLFSLSEIAEDYCLSEEHFFPGEQGFRVPTLDDVDAAITTSLELSEEALKIVKEAKKNKTK
jgi:hypothetical protein